MNQSLCSSKGVGTFRRFPFNLDFLAEDLCSNPMHEVLF